VRAITTSTKRLSVEDSQVDKGRRRVSAMLLMSAFAAPLSPLVAQPSAPPYRIRDFEWFDGARSRPVPARLYWPSAAGPGKSVPLAVFSHGIGGSRQGYSYLGKHWSAHGVASLHIQHVGSDAMVWRGNPLGMISRLQAAAQEREAVERAADVRFALDRMLSDENADLGAMVNRKRLIAAGHSYGANTSLLTVGAQVIRRGQAIDCLDPRFSAAVFISAPPFYGETDLSAVLSKVSVPSLHVTSTDDVIAIPGYYSAAADRLAIFNAIPSSQKVLAVFRGGSHSMFTDRPLTGGPLMNPRAKTATAELAIAFFDLVFESDGRSLDLWRTRWERIVAQTSTPADPRAILAPGSPRRC
jgi:dienelactone hydrolase